MVFSGVLMSSAQESEKAKLSQFLDDWHRAAAEANFEAYFGSLAEESILWVPMPQKTGQKRNLKRIQNLILIKGELGAFQQLIAIYTSQRMRIWLGLMNYCPRKWVFAGGLESFKK